MVAAELPTVTVSPSQTTRSSRVTIERRRVSGKQLRFNWDEKAETAPIPTEAIPTEAKAVVSEKGPTTEKTTASLSSPPKVIPSVTSNSKPFAASNQRPTAAGAVKSRVGEATKLGVVMLRLLKSYGITDEEIIEGLSMPTVS